MHCGRRIGLGSSEPQGATEKDQRQPRCRGADYAAFFASFLAAFGWGHAKAPFKQEIKEAEIAVAAVQGNLNDLFVRDAQKLAGSQQAQIGLTGADREAEVGAKEAIEMPRAATAQTRQPRQEYD